MPLSSATVPGGDLAPYGNPDGQVNTGDVVILQRFINNSLIPTPTELLIADVAPYGAPDGILNAGDVVVLNRAVLGLVSLPPVDVGNNSTSGILTIASFISATEGVAAIVSVQRTGGSIGVLSDTLYIPADPNGYYSAQQFTVNFADGDTTAQSFTIDLAADRYGNQGGSTQTVTLLTSSSTKTLAVTDSENIDSDGDGIINSADPDSDNDGIPDSYEHLQGLNQLDASDANSDIDGDGETALEEFNAGTDPNNSDSNSSSISINNYSKLLASDGQFNDQFGVSVAIDGDRALIGASLDDSGAGAAYLYTKDSAGNWSQQAKLTPVDAAAGDYFGISVALSGSTALVGAYENDDVGSNSGSAYIFTDDGSGNWSQQAKLTANDAGSTDKFGQSVALDGNHALIGAPYEDSAGNNAGAAYLYIKIGPGNWSQHVKFVSGDAESNGRFGNSVAIDGDRALIGAYFEYNQAGAAYLFTDDGAGNWGQQAKLIAGDAAGNFGDQFGFSVAIDGDRALIGAITEDSIGTAAGAAYLYIDDGAGNWNEQAKFTDINATQLSDFGYSVAIDGDRVLIGARREDSGGSDAGAAYFYIEDGMGNWNLQDKLIPANVTSNDFFGYSASLSGSTALIGSPRDGAGSAHIFELAPPSSGTLSIASNVLAQEGSDTLIQVRRIGGSAGVVNDTLNIPADPNGYYMAQQFPVSFADGNTVTRSFTVIMSSDRPGDQGGTIQNVSLLNAGDIKTITVTDFANPDSDGDGIPDISDAFPYDASEITDSDGDRVGDNSDAFPNDPAESTDSNGNGIGDISETIPTDLSHKIRKPFRGDFTVNERGAAVYSIPFEIPPGINNFQPDVGFLYNSSQRRGPMRMGWSISGLSTISRCPANLARDGFVEGVKYGSGERQRFCLDGEPLVLVSGGSGGVYGQTNTEYVTEKRSDLRVKAVGQSGNGPASFEVKTGDGKTLLYGSTATTLGSGTGSGSQVKDFTKDDVLAWKIDSIIDRNGNTISYDYTIYVSNLYANGAYYSRLNTIRYDGNLSGANNIIELDFRWKESLSYNEWTTRVLSDDSIYRAYESEKEAYGDYATDGFILANQDKLDVVRVKVGNTFFKEYKIAYQAIEPLSQAPIHNVSNISECHYTSSGLLCSDPIQFDWEQEHQGNATSMQCSKFSEFVGGEPAFSTSYLKSTPYFNNFGWGGGNYYSQLVGDYNNDSLMDVAVVYTFQNGNQSDITAHIALSNGNGQFGHNAPPPYSATLGGPILNHRLTGDFNNDGYSDLMATNSSSGGWNVYTILNNGDGTFANPTHQQVSTVNFIDDETYQKAVGDFNGDGNLDVIAFGIGHGSSVNDSLFSRVNGLVAYVALGNGDGSFSTASGGQLATSAQIALSLRYNRSLFTGDFNGDGITDIGSSYFASGAPHFGDPYQGSEMIVALGREDGTFADPIIELKPQSDYPITFETNSQNYREVQTADINGDGLTDILAFRSSYGGILPSDAYSTGNVVTANPDYSRRVIVSMISNGDGTFSRKIYEDIIDIDHVPEPGCESTHHGAIVADFNNDGFSDISFGGLDFYLGRGNGRFLKQGGRFISGDDVVKTGGGLTQSSFPIPDTTYGSYAFDVNRDGNADAVEVVVDSNGLRIGTSAYAEMVSQQYINKITDGYGRQIVIDYDSIMNNQVYTKGTSAVYPYRDIDAGASVVSKVTMSDGLGSNYDLSYRYTELIADLARNESLGFATVSVTDSRDNIKTTTSYAQLFPLTGLPIHQEVRLSNTLINETTSTWDFSQQSSQIGNYNYSWYTLKKNTESRSRFNDNGTLIGTTTRLFENHDEFGRPDRTTETRTDGYQTIVQESIVNNPNWLDYYIGRVDSSTETRTGPDYPQSIIRSKAFDYYPNGLLQAETIEPNDADLYLKTEYQYDSFGRVITKTQSGHSGATYSVLNRIDSKVITMPSGSNAANFEMEIIHNNAEGHQTKEYIDIRFGNRTRFIDANGLVTTSTYDGFGDLIQEVRPDSTSTTYTRDACNFHCPANAVYRIFVQSTGESFQETYFDIYDRELRLHSLGLKNKGIYADTGYDAKGRVVYSSQPYYVNDNLILSTHTQYDVLGRIKDVDSPEEGNTHFTYTGLNGAGSRTVKTQARSGLNGSINLNTEREENLSGQLVLLKNANNDDTQYKYDAFGNVKQTIDPAGNTITVNYDRLGRVILLQDPDLGNRQYGVDAFGQIRYEKDAKNQEVFQSYDRLGRLVSRNKDEGTDTWTYDTGPNAIGSLVAESSADGSSKTLGYDALGRIETETHTISGSTYVMDNDYDYAGRLNSVVYPTGFAIDYVYNGNGYLESVSSGNTTYWTVSAINAKRERLNESFGNGLSTLTSYHTTSGRIRTITTRDNTSAQELEFSFDSIGNLDQRKDLRQGLTERFNYDQLNRLTTVHLDNNLTRQHNYDDIGNILSKSDFASNYIYGQNGAGPHAVTQVTKPGSVQVNYDYDNNGNLLSGDGRTITYTSFDKPLQLSRTGVTTNFEYDANEIRTRQVKGTEVTTYINPRWDTGVHYEKEQATGAIKHKHYINAGSIPIAVYTTTNNSGATELRYLHKDHLGSVTTITDETGNVIENLSYQAFGERRNSDWSDATAQLTSITTHHGYTGHEHLDSLGLIHMNARLYDPQLGRFISADTMIPSLENLEAFNRYTYVYNNPLSLTDPSGNIPGRGLFGLIERIQERLAAEAANKLAVTNDASQNYNLPIHNSMAAGVSQSADDLSAMGNVAGSVNNLFSNKNTFRNADKEQQVALGPGVIFPFIFALFHTDSANAPDIGDETVSNDTSDNLIPLVGGAAAVATLKISGKLVGKNVKEKAKDIAVDGVQRFRNLAPGEAIGRAIAFPASQIAKVSYSGRLNYVVKETGELVIGRTGHTSLSRGGNVLAAGEARFVNGSLKSLNNASGHYRTAGSSAQRSAESAFQRAGFNAAGRYVEKF